MAHLNAGVTTGVADITELTDEQYRRIVGVNRTASSSASARSCRSSGDAEGERSWRPLLSPGIVAFPADAAYTITKHAVVGLVRVARACPCRQTGITLNAVCPGLVDTPLLTGPIRDALTDSGFPLINADCGGRCGLGCMLGEATGQAIVVQAGLEPTPTDSHARQGRESRAQSGGYRRNGWRTQVSRVLRTPAAPEPELNGASRLSLPAGVAKGRVSGPLLRPVFQGRPAPARFEYQIGVIMTLVPVSSAWTISPGPTYMVTWPMYPGLS